MATTRRLRAENPSRAFTLLEVALIVAIIGMFLVMIVGYLLAQRHRSTALPPPTPVPIPSQAPIPALPFMPVPGSPAPAAPTAQTPAPSSPAPSTPQLKTIDVSPQSTPIFR